MNLLEIQRSMFEVVRTPLTATERSRKRTLEGRDANAVATSIITPNDRLTAFERLEIYNRQYWFRLLGALMEDFEGVRALIGEDEFQKLAVAYLRNCPSRSFTLRNLGSRLPEWLAENPQYAGPRSNVAADMARLEWAEVLAFDEESKSAITLSDLPHLGADPKLDLQPYLQLLELEFEVDNLLLKIRRKTEQGSVSSNSASTTMRVGSTHKQTLSVRKRKTFVAVHRYDQSVYLKRLDRRAYELLMNLRGGNLLSSAIAAVEWRGADPNAVAEELQKWFANWASLGWLISARK